MTCRLLDTMEIGKLAQTVDPVGLPIYLLVLNKEEATLSGMLSAMVILVSTVSN